MGTQSVVQAKCLSEIVSILLDGMGGSTDAAADAAANSSAVAALLAEPDTRGAGEIVFTSWFTYFVIGYFLVSVGFWLYRLQSALSKYDPLFIIPLLQASYIVFATIGGAAWSKPPPSTLHPPAPRLLRARLTALGGSALPEAEARPTESRQPLPRVVLARAASSKVARLRCLWALITMQAAGSTSKSCRRWRHTSGSSSPEASSSCS